MIDVWKAGWIDCRVDRSNDGLADFLMNGLTNKGWIELMGEVAS